MSQAASKPGKQGERRVLSDKDEVKAAVIEATANATRALAILTPDLEPEIYDQNDFLNVLKRFILARSFARVRVLITRGRERAQSKVAPPTAAPRLYAANIQP